MEGVRLGSYSTLAWLTIGAPSAFKRFGKMSSKTRTARFLLTSYFLAIGGFIAWEVAAISGLSGAITASIALNSGNSWQKSFFRGDRIIVALSDRACGVIPSALHCDARYSLTLRKIRGRWCEYRLRLVGSDAELGGRCRAQLEDSVISLLGAQFSFDDQGEVFYDKHPVGRLEIVAPPD
jgi:hypothetical protein